MSTELYNKKMLSLRFIYHLKERVAFYASLARHLDAQLENARRSFLAAATAHGYAKFDEDFASLVADAKAHGCHARSEPDGKDFARLELAIQDELTIEEADIDATIRAIPRSAVYTELRRVLSQVETNARAFRHNSDLIPRIAEDISASVEKRAIAASHLHDDKLPYMQTHIFPRLFPDVLTPPDEIRSTTQVAVNDNSFGEDQVDFFVPTVHWLDLQAMTAWTDRNVSRVTFPPQLFGHRFTLKDLLESPSAETMPSTRPFQPARHQVFSVWVTHTGDFMKPAHELFDTDLDSRAILLDPTLKAIPLKFLDRVYLDCMHEYNIKRVLVLYGPVYTNQHEHDFVTQVSFRDVPEKDRICVCSESIEAATRLRNFSERLMQAHGTKRTVAGSTEVETKRPRTDRNNYSPPACSDCEIVSSSESEGEMDEDIASDCKRARSQDPDRSASAPAVLSSSA